MLEVELKFAADGLDPLEHLAAAAELGSSALGVVHEVDEVDRYLDTARGALAAAGWACRLRTRGDRTIASLKGPAEVAEDAVQELHRRPELEGAASDSLEPARWSPSEARDLVDRLRDAEPLVERLRLHQRRVERDVLVDGHGIGTLTLDRVEVLAGGASRGRFHVVELELHPGQDAAVLPELADALREVPGLRPERRTKLERALALVGAPGTPGA